MDQQTIRSKIIAAILSVAPDLEGSEIQGDATLRESYDLDSADFLNIIIRLHDAFEIDIPDVDFGKLTTVDKMAAYLSTQLTKAPDGSHADY